jgi:hypothetical protein
MDRKDIWETLRALEGKLVNIQQSLSRSRHVGGHDRHFAATLAFTLRIESVNWQISGGHLYLNGEDSWLGILLDNVSKFSKEDQDTFVIVEHFESKTERRTTIKML